MSSIATSLLSALIGRLAQAVLGPVFDDIANKLGIQSQDKQVLSELQQIEGELQTMNQALQTIEQQATAIQQQITDTTYQSLLGKYEDNRSVIAENFTSLTSAMAGLQLADSTMRQKSLDDMNALLAIDNANLVAEAMQNVNTSIAGDPAVGYKGLLSYQQQIINDLISNQWTSASTLAVSGLDGPQPSFQWKQGTREQVPDANSINYGGTFYDSFRIITASPGTVIVPNLNNNVIPALTAMLNTQAQGFYFLYLAFNNGPQQGQLQTITNNLNAQLTAMKGLFEYYSTPGGAFDAFMGGLLTRLGQYPTTSYLTSMYPNWGGDRKSWPYRSGWMWADGANLPGAQGRHAVLKINSTNFTGPQTVVWFGKKATWAGNNFKPGYVEPILLGWNWSQETSCQAQSAAGYASLVVTPLMNSFLGWWLQLGPTR